MSQSVSKKDRYLGCILGGAVGDALGYPVEFMSEETIRHHYGAKGIRTLAQAGHPALVSDDTQMTLFVINGVIHGHTNKKSQWDLLDDSVWLAHQEWLGTQGDTSRMEDPLHPKMWIFHDKRLHVQRAPGLTCLSAIRDNEKGGSFYEGPPINNSKGCGSVMKAAPLGLMTHYDPEGDHGDYLIGHYKKLMAYVAQTHGHPLGYLSALALAQIVFHITQYNPAKAPYGCKTLEDVIVHSYTCSIPEGEIIYNGVKEAIGLAKDPAISDINAIHQLGEGWVAEEALYIAVFCAVRYQNDFAAAIRAAVNHKGDSDSTGSICGNILGAWLGRQAVEEAFDLADLELRDLIEELTNDFYQVIEYGVPVDDSFWSSKYCHGIKSHGDSIPAQPAPRVRIHVTCGTLDFDHIGTDMVVCPTDSRFSGSGGIDRQLHHRGGKALEEACRKLEPAKAGDVRITPGFDLSAKYVIHAVTPSYSPDRKELLTQCYEGCLHTACQQVLPKPFAPGAKELSLSISVPLLGTGSLGWPIETSMECAWKAILRFLEVKTHILGAHFSQIEIRLCTTEAHLPVIRPYLRRYSNAFFTMPEYWSPMGNADLWFRFMHYFDHDITEPQKASLPRFLETMRLHLTETFSCKKLIPGPYSETTLPGMSDGVSVDFWMRRGLPMLAETVCEKNLAPFEAEQIAFSAPQEIHLDRRYLWNLPEGIREALLGMEQGRSVFDTLLDFHTKEKPQPSAAPTPVEDRIPDEVVPLHKVGLKYTPLTKKALAICFDAHKNQTDNSGLPYVFHPMHLAEQMETEEEICTALLHDVLEDTPYIGAQLRQAGIPETVLEALRLLTHKEDVPYMDYVLALRHNPLARKVKQADLLHNSDLERLDEINTYVLRRRQKYLIAAAILEEDWYDQSLKHYRKRLPLDDKQLYFLSVFYRKDKTSKAEVLKYSLDVEKAEDSHYEFSAAGGKKLHQALIKAQGIDQSTNRSLPELLAWYFETGSEYSFTSLLKKLGIPYHPFHFD